MAIELGCVCVRRRREENSFAIWVNRSRRMLGVQIVEPALRELVPELRMSGPSDPERMPRAEDVVEETRVRQLGGLDGAAQLMFCLEHANAPAASRVQLLGRERA